MRHAYPLIWCLPEDIQAKLLGQISDINAVPDQVWSEWQEGRNKDPSLIDRDVNYDKFIRQAPSRSRK